MAANFSTWLDTLVSEKGYDLDDMLLTTELDSGAQKLLPLSFIIEHIKIADPTEQRAIKNVLIRIDFANGDCLDFFKHLGGAIHAEAEQFINL